MRRPIQQTDEIAEYQDVVQNVFAGLGAAQASGSEPTVVAEVIYRAATDESEEFRYSAGDDAAQMIAKRKAEDDPTFLSDMRRQFKLHE